MRLLSLFPLLGLLGVSFGPRFARAVSLPELTVKDSLAEPSLKWDLEGPVLEDISRFRAQPILQPVIQGSESASPQFMIRGSEPHQNRLFIEGIPLTDPVFNSDQLILVPSTASRIWEVYPSGPPAAFLEDGTGGAINIRVFKPLRASEVSFQKGSYGYQRLAGSVPRVLGAQLDLEWTQSEEDFQYSDPSGSSLKRRENNGFYRVSVLPQWNLIEKRQVSLRTFSVNSFQKTEIPGPTSQPMTKQLDGFFHLTGFKNNLSLSTQLQLENRAFWKVQKETLFDFSSQEREKSDYLTLGAQSHFLWSGDNQKLKWGAAANYSKYDWVQRGERESPITSPREYQQIKIPVFFESKIQVGESGLAIQPEVLGTLEYLDSKLNHNKYLGFSPRISLSQVVSEDSCWIGGAGYYFRNPSLSELMGGSENILPNPDLKREEALKLEVTYAYKKMRLSLFSSSVANLIQTVFLDKSVFQSENIGRVFLKGADGNTMISLNRSVRILLGASVLQSENRSSDLLQNGKSLPLRFPLKSYVELVYNSNRWKGGVRTAFFSSSFLDKENTQKMESYFLHDLFSEMSFGVWGKVDFSVQNIFDLTLIKMDDAGQETQQALGGFNEYPSAGRRVNLRWTVSL